MDTERAGGEGVGGLSGMINLVHVRFVMKYF